MTIDTTAVAEYKKPRKTSSPNAETTTSAATRGGCLDNSNTDLTAIAPYSHVGQTVATHPTFIWFVPDSESFPLEFHLDEYVGDGQVKTIYRQTLSSKPGIMSLSLPNDLPGLTVGQKYLWKVVMRCTRYNSVVVMAEMEIVAPTPEFKTTFNNTSGTSMLVDFYATNGLWYDALAMASKTDFRQMELQNQLIQELAAIETSSDSKPVQQQGQKLIEISDFLKASQSSKK